MFSFSQSNHSLHIPDGAVPESAFSRCTHLGIGAHQDDLEFMALHGILECFQHKDRWFGGVTCTDGADSSRMGAYADFTNEQMIKVRRQEQKTAATIGQYSFMAQLGHPSTHARMPPLRQKLSGDLLRILQASQPKIVYTHNPFDKHATHVGVFLATIDALHQMPATARPKQLFGCEVWRGLDWLPDSEKTVHDVSAHPDLTASLNGVFDSQITGGKRYDLAIGGRRLANATFWNPHEVDGAKQLAYAIDLSALMADPDALRLFMQDKLSRLSSEVFEQLDRLTRIED